MYVMREIYNSMRSKMLVVNMRVIYIRQNLADERAKKEWESKGE